MFRRAGVVLGSCLRNHPVQLLRPTPVTITMTTQPISDMSEFREEFSKARHVVVLSGAGISAESGIPTFRGAGGMWRSWVAQDLATPTAFYKNPSLVWEFYSYRREVVLKSRPNAGHKAIADCQKRFLENGWTFDVVTQNIDGLHQAAGAAGVLELHGSLFKTRCTKCGHERMNRSSPICESLAGKGAPDPDAKDAKIPEKDLPRCEEGDCRGLLRPAVVWFGESLDGDVMETATTALGRCDFCIVVGTSSVVYPAAMFAPQVAGRGVPVAEFNLESTPATSQFGYHFEGKAGDFLPPALAP